MAIRLATPAGREEEGYQGRLAAGRTMPGWTHPNRSVYASFFPTYTPMYAPKHPAPAPSHL